MSISRDEMIFTVIEFDRLLLQAKRIVRQREGRAGPMTGSPEALLIADLIRFALKAWLRDGAYVVYYCVSGGSLHTSRLCSNISEYTALSPETRLVGTPLAEVLGHGYRVCGRCRKRSTESRMEQTSRNCQNWIDRLMKEPNEVAPQLD